MNKSSMLALSLSITGTCMVSSAIILILAIYQLCIKDLSEWVDKTYRNMTIRVMLVCTCCTVGVFTHLLIKTINFPNLILLIEEDVYEAFAKMWVDGIYLLILLREGLKLPEIQFKRKYGLREASIIGLEIELLHLKYSINRQTNGDSLYPRFNRVVETWRTRKYPFNADIGDKKL